MPPTQIVILWILSVMRFLEPRAPWRGTFETTATAIATESAKAPLFKGQRGVEQTVDMLLAIGKYESNFDPRAKGDSGASIGLFQIAPATAGLPRDQLFDPSVASATAIRLVHQSFVICAARPFDERLAWYAHGGDGCSALGAPASRHRMQKAMWLFEHKKLDDFRKLPAEEQSKLAGVALPKPESEIPDPEGKAKAAPAGTP